MLILKLGSELQNLAKILQSAMKILTKYKLYFHEVECTPPPHPFLKIQDGPTFCRPIGKKNTE